MSWDLVARRGAQGPQGPAGPKGDSGQTGPAGAQGYRGAIGPQGLTGATGAQGIEGEVGPAGVQGPMGPTGDAGEATYEGSVRLWPATVSTFAHNGHHANINAGGNDALRSADGDATQLSIGDIEFPAADASGGAVGLLDPGSIPAGSIWLSTTITFQSRMLEAEAPNTLRLELLDAVDEILGYVLLVTGVDTVPQPGYTALNGTFTPQPGASAGIETATKYRIALNRSENPSGIKHQAITYFHIDHHYEAYAVQGPQGVQGPPGATGRQGPTGQAGPQGIAGPAGLQGPVGPQGPGLAVGVVTPNRALDVPFIPHAVKPVWCAYTIQIVAEGEIGSSSEGKVELKSENAEIPEIVRGVVRTVQTNVDPIIQTMVLTFICPAGWRILLDSTVIGMATVAIVQQVEVLL